MSNEKLSRSVLPIPDRTHVGLTTYDAKDPATEGPPIEQLRPPKGAPNSCLFYFMTWASARLRHLAAHAVVLISKSWRRMGLSTPDFTPPRCVSRRVRPY